MVFSLQQLGGRLPVNGEYYKYPFIETLQYACVSVFHMGIGDKYLKAFDRSKLSFLSPIKRERENTGRCELKGGEKYVIVPACEVPDTEGDFYVSIYID